ncbi:MAG: DUF4446 family protein [Alicyclobacillus herbarius]|uniref:DUF4446 family protein n=1 Tax=Alicyclobacillus herbarius TaxID=122960 RepID=UPI0004175BDF|nr:DUF4446 family protein [Alicyclobacillus herbarius]MCL6631770.1 DUF4446 family protein [Alicyclobacillus herbarius]
MLNGLGLTDAQLYAGVAGLLALVAIILSIIAIARQSRLRRRFDKWKSIHSSADLDAVYEQTLDAVASLRQEVNRLTTENHELRKALQGKISSARLVRFNAFSDVGSDLSFSLALLDDDQNGVVLSSIYGRDESRVYAKPVQHGQSTYPLTEEEQMVIEGRERTLQR